MHHLACATLVRVMDGSGVGRGCRALPHSNEHEGDGVERDVCLERAGGLPQARPADRTQGGGVINDLW
jgi:hypothetical protein